MHPFGHDIRRASAALLLAVFLVGGLVAPAVHRAEHSLSWAKVKAETSETCDHSEHDVTYEAHPPAFLDDDCLLCVRHLVYIDGPQPGLVTYLDHTAYQLPEQLVLYALHLSLAPIRGPPATA